MKIDKLANEVKRNYAIDQENKLKPFLASRGK